MPQLPCLYVRDTIIGIIQITFFILGNRVNGEIAS